MFYGHYRAGGNVWTPKRIGGTFLYLPDARDVVLDGSSRVQTWNDHASASLGSPTQATAGFRPRYTASDATINGQPSIQCSTADQTLISYPSSTAISSAFCITLVFKMTVTTGLILPAYIGNYAGAGVPDSNGINLQGNGQNNFLGVGYTGLATNATDVAPSTSWVIFTMAGTSGSLPVGVVNGAQRTITNGGGFLWRPLTAASSVGLGHLPSGITDVLDGSIAYCRMGSAQPSVADIVREHRWCGSKFGIATA